MTEVYLNHKYIGDVSDGEAFYKEFLEERRRGDVPFSVSIRYEADMDTIGIASTRGRAQRPLVVVKDGKTLVTEVHLRQLQRGDICWDDLLRQGLVEYLDAAEEENALVAYDSQHLTPEHTHMELAPYGLLGVAVSLVPFGNHSPGARLLMGGKNQKQAVGLYVANFMIRMDMDVHLLHYPQSPIVRTHLNEFGDFDKHPAGQNLVVAIMSYKGYNMDDSIIMNKASLERGVARSSYYRPHPAQELRYSGGLVDEIGIPDKDVKGYKSEQDYKLLEGDGIVYPEAKVSDDDVIIGKTSPPRFLSSLEEFNVTSASRRESSIVIKQGEKGIVDLVLLTENEEGNKLVQVKIRKTKIPEIGDKFTSRHGQKGVIGLVAKHTDLPFSASGVVPDLIFSPHGIPSRMTISHLIELIGAKVGALSGRFVDGTIFAGETEKDLRQELLSLGFADNGTETFYDGETGRVMSARVYVGCMYYLKLKHMVSNKIRSRARGPIQLLTRQPTEGRGKEGGLRLGEMEKDTLVAHGASLLLKERFDSDCTIVPVCDTCGLIAIKDGFKDRSYCPLCGDNSEIHEIEISYAYKLLLDELKSLGIYPKISLKNKY